MNRYKLHQPKETFDWDTLRPGLHMKNKHGHILELVKCEERDEIISEWGAPAAMHHKVIALGWNIRWIYIPKEQEPSDTPGWLSIDQLKRYEATRE